MEEPKSTAKRGAKTAAAVQEDRITLLPLSELHDFPNHPFKVRDDEAMQETAESIRQYGVLVPAIVRPREDGGYEIIAGHRRRHGSELAGLSAMPCIVRQMDDDTATILMVDSNIQRENILPSERAQAYKMKLEAIKRQGTRHDLTSDQLGQKLSGKTSREVIAENSNDSPTQIQRYIRLTELSPELQQMVDEKKIGMTPAVEISYLKPEEQQMLLTAIDSEQATPSLSQAQRMKKLSRDGKLNDDTMLDIMMEQKNRRATTSFSRRTSCANTSRAPIRRRRWRKPSSSCWTHGCASASVTSPDNRIRPQTTTTPTGQRAFFARFCHIQRGAKPCISTRSSISRRTFPASSVRNMSKSWAVPPCPAHALPSAWRPVRWATRRRSRSCFRTVRA